MTRTLLALVLAGFAAGPVLAADMSCADFSALDGNAQAEMVGGMAPSGDDGGGMMMSGPADDDAAGMMSSDDASGSMMSSDDASGSMMSSDDGSDADQMTANVASLCAEHPEMSLDDAMSNARQ